MEIRLNGKRALVTGGSSGIGRAIALALGEAGARVGVNYIAHPEPAAEVVDHIKAGGNDAQPLPADVSDPVEALKMFERLEQTWGGIDILVNCAGIDGPRAMGWEADPAVWRKVVDINLTGAFLCAREALRHMMVQQGGVILNITSVHETIPWSGYSAYTASKAALSMLTKSLAQEAAPHKVRVLALAPGAIQTPINEAVWSDPKQLADLLDKIPLGRMGQPEEVARMAVVLVSDVASYLTGTTVFVDGGMTLYADFAHGG
jgi:NAD(P)-dependent dehydrogenase (short-subunit alcohol dehydrogenase family)